MQCAICHDDVTAETGRTVMSCGHEFHIRCLVQWLQKPDGAGNCPCCRKEPTEMERLIPVESESESESETETESVVRYSQARTDPVSTPLMDAIVIGDVAEVQRILASSTHLEEKDSEGDTALYWAMIYRQETIIKMLLAAGASLLALHRDRTLNEALLTACSHNSMACIRACLMQGADINYVQPLTGKTPLMAIIRSYHPIATAEFLIAKGASVSAIDAKGWNAVMWAAHLRGDEAAWMTLLLAGTALQPRIKESDAATKVQSLWRGVQVRKTISSLKVYARMRSAHKMKLSVAPRGSIGYTLFREHNNMLEALEAFSPLSIE